MRVRVSNSPKRRALDNIPYPLPPQTGLLRVAGAKNRHVFSTDFLSPFKSPKSLTHVFSYLIFGLGGHEEGVHCTTLYILLHCYWILV